MSFVIAQPEMIAAAAGELASIRSAINAANAAAAAQTTGVMSAAADEVSTAVAALFSSHAQAYQAASAQAAAFHAQVVRTLTVDAGAYASAEAANAGPNMLAAKSRCCSLSANSMVTSSRVAGPAAVRQ